MHTVTALRVTKEQGWGTVFWFLMSGFLSRFFVWKEAEGRRKTFWETEESRKLYIWVYGCLCVYVVRHLLWIFNQSYPHFFWPKKWVKIIVLKWFTFGSKIKYYLSWNTIFSKEKKQQKTFTLLKNCSLSHKHTLPQIHFLWQSTTNINTDHNILTFYYCSCADFLTHWRPRKVSKKHVSALLSGFQSFISMKKGDLFVSLRINVPFYRQ